MADGPALSLQKALIAGLKADPAIAALVAARVYDEPPQGATLPMIRLGTMDVQIDRMTCTSDWDVGFVVEAHSRPVAGRVEATRVAEAVIAALEGNAIGLAPVGFRVVWIDFETSAVSREADGQTYRAAMVFTAMLEPAP